MKNNKELYLKKQNVYVLLNMLARNALILRENLNPEKDMELYGLNSLQLGYIVDIANFLEMPEDFENMSFIKNAKKEFKKYFSPMTIKEIEEKIKQLKNQD